MNKKVLIPLCLALFSIGLSACDLRHAHEFGDEYAYDESQHWFKAVCEHVDEKGSPENHSFSEWFVSQQKTCEKDEILTRYCDDCGYEETKVGETAGHTLESVAGQKATCKSDGVKDHQHCSTCGRDFDSNGTELSSVTIEKLGHNKLDQWYSDETSHYKVCENDGCTLTFDEAEHTFNEWHTKYESTCQSNKVEQRECSVCGYEDTREIEGKADHNLVDVSAVNSTCTENGVEAHKKCSVCESLFDIEGNEVTLADLVIEASHDFNSSYTITDTTHSLMCSVCEEVFVEDHSYDATTGKCVCGKELYVTLIGSHSGTAQWDMATNEKLSTNGVFHQNVSNVTVDENGELEDFSIQIQYRGWENNGELTYFYTIKSVDGVLTLDNQLGVSPWSFTTFTLSDEHKTRLASEEGLDFVVKFDKENQNLKLYIYTGHELVELHSLNTYYSSMDNFYKVKYVVTGTATVETKVYETYDTDINTIFSKLEIDLSEHDFVDVEAVSPTCTEDGVIAHKHCNICNKNYDSENKELLVIVDPMLGHSESDTLTYDDTFHWYECKNSNCNETFEKIVHTMVYSSTKIEATETVEGIEIWKCESCEYTQERNIGSLEHVHTFDTSIWLSNETSHWNPSLCGHEVKGNETEHSLINVEEVEKTCTENGVEAHLECEICNAKFNKNGELVEETDLIIPASHNLKSEYTVLDSQHYIGCENCSEVFEQASHCYDSATGECVCGKDIYVTLLGSHSDTSQWDMANNEKLSTNGIFHQNVSNVAVDEYGNLVDFKLQIQYRGWENNGERTYFYTIKSVNGVLTIDNQLGIEPWSFTTFTLSEEHKIRLASEEGLDFVVKFDKDNQIMKLYIYTEHELVELHSLNTYFGGMDNFYKLKFVLTGEATVETKVYNSYDTNIATIFNELNISLTDHNVLTDKWLFDNEEHWNPCTGCDLKSNSASHSYDSTTKLCECGSQRFVSQTATHLGTDAWSLSTDEKITSNSVIKVNVSNASVDNDNNLDDFSTTITVGGWGTAYEGYYFNINSASGTLSVYNQLGVDPWTISTFTLEEEHKSRLISEKGLDLYIYYNHDAQTFGLYVVTNKELVLLHEINTYSNKTANLYELKYKVTGTVGTINTTIYKTYDTAIGDVVENIETK